MNSAEFTGPTWRPASKLHRSHGCGMAAAVRPSRVRDGREIARARRFPERSPGRNQDPISVNYRPQNPWLECGLILADRV